MGDPFTLLWDWLALVASGLGFAGGRGGGALAHFVSELRLVCGVAGAELAFDGMAEGWGLSEEWGRRSVEEEEEEGEAAESHGEQMEGSEMLLEKACSWLLLMLPCKGGWEELWSEPEDRLSVLSAGEGEQEEDWEWGKTEEERF